VGAVVTNAVRVAVIAVLGRTLTSTDFGIVAAAIAVNALLFGIRDIGVGTALIQRKTLTPAHVSTSFAFSTYLGLGMSVLLWLAAPLIADLYDIPSSTNVLRVLGLLFAIRGISTTSRMVTQRAMNFRSIAIIDASSFAIGSLASIVLAVAGAGAWALVAGYLAEEIVSSGLYLYSNPTSAALRIDGSRLRELLGFGTKQTVGQVIGSLANNADNFIIGHQLGATTLGFYARAYDLIKFPSAVFGTIVGSVLLPAFSRLQDQRERLADNFRRVTFVNALGLLPASAVLIILAPEMILLLMGPGWDDAVLPFRILAVSMLMRTSQRLAAIVATAAGAVGSIAVAYFIYFVFVVGGALFAVQWGIGGVAVSTAIALFVCNAACSYPAIRVCGLPVHRLLGAHLPGVALAGLAALVAWVVATRLRDQGMSSTIVLAIASLGATVAVMAAVVICLRGGYGDFAWLRNELARFRHRRTQPLP
jgi:O-antigen/teichoic acid export membrane protein